MVCDNLYKLDNFGYNNSVIFHKLCVVVNLTAKPALQEIASGFALAMTE